MSRFVYEGKEYQSKADLIRELFVDGKLKNEAHSKSQIAKELGITVQTVHATLNKVLNSPSAFKLKSVGKRGKITDVVVISPGCEIPEGTVGKKIPVTWAPNVWGLPVTSPTTYVIDPTFKGDIYLKDEERENSLQELIN